MARTSHPADDGASLAVLGLSVPEERIYRELVRVRTASPDELERRLGLAPGDGQWDYESLTRRGLASWTTGTPRRLMAAPPAAAVDALALRVEREIQQARVAAARLSEEWSAADHDRKADELVEIVTGEDPMARRFQSLLDSAEREILGFNAAPLLVAAESNVEFNEAALARRVRSRAIYEHAVFETPGVADKVARCQAAGEEARIIDRLPCKLIVVDRATALVPVHVDRSGLAPSAAILHGPLTRPLVALFEQLWSRATPLAMTGELGGAGDAGELPTDDDRALLSLLFGGLSDEAAGRQLGISRRTVNRRLSRLMHDAGVGTRLQLAFVAGERGWLSASSSQARSRQAGQPPMVGMKPLDGVS